MGRLCLAPAFSSALIFGAVSADLLFELICLLMYLSQCERNLIATALHEGLDSDSQDELLDLLDRMGVKTVPYTALIYCITSWFGNNRSDERQKLNVLNVLNGLLAGVFVKCYFDFFAAHKNDKEIDSLILR